MAGASLTRGHMNQTHHCDLSFTSGRWNCVCCRPFWWPLNDSMQEWWKHKGSCRVVWLQSCWCCFMCANQEIILKVVFYFHFFSMCLIIILLLLLSNSQMSSTCQTHVVVFYTFLQITDFTTMWYTPFQSCFSVKWTYYRPSPRGLNLMIFQCDLMSQVWSWCLAFLSELVCWANQSISSVLSSPGGKALWSSKVFLDMTDWPHPHSFHLTYMERSTEWWERTWLLNNITIKDKICCLKEWH